MRLLRFSQITFVAMSKPNQMTFEANISLDIIPSTITMQSDGTHTVQLKLDGILTATSDDVFVGLNDEQLREAVAEGDIQVKLVNRG